MGPRLVRHKFTYVTYSIFARGKLRQCCRLVVGREVTVSSFNAGRQISDRLNARARCKSQFGYVCGRHASAMFYARICFERKRAIPLTPPAIPKVFDMARHTARLDRHIRCLDDSSEAHPKSALIFEKELVR